MILTSVAFTLDNHERLLASGLSLRVESPWQQAVKVHLCQPLSNLPVWIPPGNVLANANDEASSSNAFPVSR